MSPPEHASCYQPPNKTLGKTHVSSKEEYEKLYKESIDDPEGFWSNIADQFHWKQRWGSIFSRYVVLISGISQRQGIHQCHHNIMIEVL